VFAIVLGVLVGGEFTSELEDMFIVVLPCFLPPRLSPMGHGMVPIASEVALSIGLPQLKTTNV